jgi:hypothetical protein
MGYRRVSNVAVVSWRGSDIDTLSQSFNCFNISINDFTIEAGDIVGACVYDPAGIFSSQLDIVGQNASGYLLMQMDDASQCRQNSLPMSISSSQLNNVLNSWILHVYANITGRHNRQYINLLILSSCSLYPLFLYSYEYSYHPSSYNYNVHN